MSAVYIPGPRHPDLFDGETPISVPTTGLHIYRVQVAPVGEESAARTQELAAINALQACAFALSDYVHARHDTGITMVDVLSAQRLDDAVTRLDRRIYLTRMRGVL